MEQFDPNNLKRTRSESAKQLMVISNKTTDAEDGFSQRTAAPSVSAQFLAVGLVGAVVSVAVGWALVGDLAGVLCGLGVYGIAMAVAHNALRTNFPYPVIGLCNVATIARLMLVSVLIAALFAASAPPWAVFVVAIAAFALDGVDGWLARREGRASAFGARFDMEVDSVLALVLALMAWQSGTVGAYVIILGLPRYVFWIAQFPCPWLDGDLPERFSRKVVCVLQITALILVLFPLISIPLAGAVAGLAALALVWSFWIDVRLLWRARA